MPKSKYFIFNDKEGIHLDMFVRKVILALITILVILKEMEIHERSSLSTIIHIVLNF